MWVWEALLCWCFWFVAETVRAFPAWPRKEEMAQSMERRYESVLSLETFNFQSAPSLLPSVTLSPGHTPPVLLRENTACQKQLTALKFRKINPFWAHLLAYSAISSLVYTGWKALVYPFGSSQFRKAMRLEKKKRRLQLIFGGNNLKCFSDFCFGGCFSLLYVRFALVWFS